MGDSHFWNERFKVRELKIMNHERVLEEDIKYFQKAGRVLDIACGDGRNAIYLAAQGYSVQAIDFSEEALNRLTYFAEKEKLNIETKLVDLANEDSLNSLKQYDVVIVNHYRLNPKFYKKLMDSLNDGGVLWVNGFREVPRDNPNITEEDILRGEDFETLYDYKLIDNKLYEAGERKFMRCIWKK